MPSLGMQRRVMLLDDMMGGIIWSDQVKQLMCAIDKLISDNAKSELAMIGMIGERR